MASIARAVAQFKDDPAAFLPDTVILAAATAAGYQWRERVFGPVLTVHLMVLQMLWGNVSCRRVLRIAGLAASDTAYVNARVRLPVDVLGRVLFELTHAARQRYADFGRWRGHRVVLMDGSGVSMPDKPALGKAFGLPGGVKPGCGFPVMHTLWLFDAATGLLVDSVLGRWNRHDQADAAKLHPMLQPGDVLVADRAFCSFAHLALLVQDGIHAVLRAHQRLKIDFTPGRKCAMDLPQRQRRGVTNSRQIRVLGKTDHVVQWQRPNECPDWMSPEAFRALPGTLIVRELRYQVEQRGYRTKVVTLVTTLLDPEGYPASALAELYLGRWEVETNLRHLKQTMGMDVLRSTTVQGVQKELLAYAIAYNLVRLRMLAAAIHQGVAVSRVSFIDAMDVLRHAVNHRPWIVLVVRPHRPGRHEPRAIKRRKDRYTYLTRPREQLRQTLGITSPAA